MSWRKNRLFTVMLSVTLLGAAVVGPDAAAAAAAPCRVAAVGDLAGADDYLVGSNRTAALVRREDPAKVVLLGDLAYNRGTLTEYRKYFDPAWSDLKPILRPTPGNHENYSGRSGYYSYFSGYAPWYSFDACGWQFISVDQYAGIAKGAAFIAHEAARFKHKPIAVFWHAPRYSSGFHGNSTQVQPLWAAAVEAGAKIVLVGHDHNYERFAPMGARGNHWPEGTRQFVSGLGGHHPRPISWVVANSRARVTGTPGALFLTLRSTGYDWEFKNVDNVIRDRGTTNF